jgi:putative holliday junction resolvase
MRILGIDYGEKRIGLALSDETQTFAKELGILSPKEFQEKIREYINEHQVAKIVLGWPLNMNGEETKTTLEVKKFKEKLEKIIDIPVNTIDERYTSQMASHLPGGDKDLDSLAAQIILQNYLDKTKGTADARRVPGDS